MSGYSVHFQIDFSRSSSVLIFSDSIVLTGPDASGRMASMKRKSVKFNGKVLVEGILQEAIAGN